MMEVKFMANNNGVTLGTIYEDVAALTERVATLEHLHSDSGWIALVLSDGIGQHNENTFPARYRKIGNRVIVEGAINGVTAASTVIATLPSGFRPSKNRYYTGAKNGGETDTYEVRANGQLVLVDSTNDSYIATNYHFINTEFFVD